jgi:HSP20 family protein
MARRDLDEWLWQVGAELQRLSEEILPSSPKVAKCKSWEPRVDVIDTGDRVLLKAEIAGVKGEDIRISYSRERHSLTLRGVRNEEDRPENCCGAHLLEIYYGEFQREIKLPSANLDVQGIRAQYRNGFLLVVIPKLTDELTQVVITESVTVKRF